jgi:hypothetical protein
VPLFDDGGTFAACALCPVQRAGGCFNERVIVVTPVRYRRGAHKLPPEAMQRHSPVPRSIAKIGPRGSNWTPDRHYAFSEHNAICRRFESGRQDLNLRPPGPQPGALPDCATPRYVCFKRATGIEPALEAWKASVQPQHFAREAGRANDTRARSRDS